MSYAKVAYQPQAYQALGPAQNKVTTHVDESRLILGTDSHIFIYDRKKMKQKFAFKLSRQGDIRNYSFQDCYIITDTNTTTTLYSVTDALYKKKLNSENSQI